MAENTMFPPLPPVFFLLLLSFWEKEMYSTQGPSQLSLLLRLSLTCIPA